MTRYEGNSYLLGQRHRKITQTLAWIRCPKLMTLQSKDWCTGIQTKRTFLVCTVLDYSRRLLTQWQRMLGLSCVLSILHTLVLCRDRDGYGV